MKNLKLFDTDKGVIPIRFFADSKLTRRQIIECVKGTPVFIDASTFAENVHDVYTKALFSGIDHPILIFNRTTFTERENDIKGLYSINEAFSNVVGETYYGNILLCDLMLIPDDSVKDIQQDTTLYVKGGK